MRIKLISNPCGTQRKFSFFGHIFEKAPVCKHNFTLRSAETLTEKKQRSVSGSDGGFVVCKSAIF